MFDWYFISIFALDLLLVTLMMLHSRFQVRYPDNSGEFIHVDSPRWRRSAPLCLSEMAMITDAPQLSAGTEIEVYWKPEKRFFAGTVQSFDVSLDKLSAGTHGFVS